MTKTDLRIAPRLTLPVQGVTETFAILAKRGVGKSYTGSVLAEEMLGAGAQIVVIDPLDAWWGLRSSADGQSPGLAVYVIGDPLSDHCDLPLLADAGALIADLVVDEGISVILSLRHLSKGKARQFVADFAERLYHRKGEPQHRTPLHVFIDEADAFVPQRVMNEAARAHGAIDDLVRRGRSSGIGVTLISQRAAVVSKDVLTQCEVLIALRTVSPQDRKALEAWIQAHDAHDQHDEFMASLASLQIGEAWVWSPGWLELFSRVHIRTRRTFDSSATPKAGTTVVMPKARAVVDLAALGERMAEAVERADAENPAKLKARVQTLERELARARASADEAVARQQSAIAVAVEQALAEQPAPDTAYTDALERQNADLVAQQETLRVALGAARSRLEIVTRDVGEVLDATSPSSIVTPERQRAAARPTPRPAAPAAPRPAAAVAPRPAPVVSTGPGDSSLAKMERELLTVLAQYPAGRTKKQAAFLIGRSANGGGYRNTVSSLRTKGCIEPPATTGDPNLVITQAGLEALGSYQPLPSGDDLLTYWLGRLGKMEREILETLVGGVRRGYQIPKEQVAEMLEKSASGGGFRNAYSKLRTAGLLEGDQPAAEFMESIG